MRPFGLCVLLGASAIFGCTDKGEAVRAAQPHLESFDQLRARALRLLELRSSVERKRLLVEAKDDPDSLPENLEPVLEQMQAERVELTAEQVAQGEALFWRMLDGAFDEEPDVLQGEIVYLEKDGSISRFAHPRESEVPAGVDWYGLRQPRTFAALARCVTDGGVEPCVLVQLRPREHAGSAGLTVAFRRAGRP